jgi:lipoprotein NlpI
MKGMANTMTAWMRLEASARAWKRGSYDEVIALTTDAIGDGLLAPEYGAIAHYQRGLAYNRKGLHDEAMLDFSEAIRLNPEFARAYYQRGYLARQAGQDELAIADYDCAIQFDPQLVHAYINRGVLRIDQGLYYQALQDFHKAIRLDPTRARIYSDRGCAYYGSGHYDRALEDFDQALRLDPNYVVAHLHRGHVHCARGNYAEAIEAYSEAVRVDPGFALGRKNRAHVYFFEGRFADAAADYARYVELCPHDASTVILRYLACARSGEASVTELARHAQALDLNKWPGAAIAMFLGQSTPETVLTQASSDSESVKNDGRHLGFFYLGQYHLLQENAAGAVEMFRLALLDGARDCFEYELAVAELDRLGVRVLVPRARR